ncbi:MAG: HAD family hydrolase [Akkermansia sp.]
MDDLLSVQGDRLLKIAVYDFQGAVNNSYPHLRHLADRFQVAVSGERWMDISRKGANKGNALELIQRRLGISAVETMVFGDQMNDAEMMRQAGFSYAVANAVPEIRKMAAFTAPSNEDNGVIHVLREVLAGRN